MALKLFATFDDAATVFCATLTGKDLKKIVLCLGIVHRDEFIGHNWFEGDKEPSFHITIGVRVAGMQHFSHKKWVV